MSGKTKKVLTASIIALIAFTVIIALAPKHGYSISMNTAVEVRDGKAFPENATHTFHVKASGKYSVRADWSNNEQPGFVTGFTLTDENGNTVYSISGGLLSFDTEPMKLKAGKYLCRLDYLCDEEAYNAFQRTNGLPEGMGDTSWFKDGEWFFGCNIKLYEADRTKDAVMVCCGVIIALMLAFTIITLVTDDKSDASKYDERQIAMQGKAYKRGFFSIVLINTGLMVFSSLLGSFAQTGVYLMLGIVLGTCVTVTTLIMNDAYFRLDQNKKVFYILFGVLAVINAALGIRNILKGNAVVDGMVSFAGTANLFSGLMIVYVFAVLLLKKIRDGKEACDEES